VDKFASLLTALGIEGPTREYVLPPSPAARERIDGFLASSDLVGRRLVLMHPGTSERGAGKRWPPERFAALAARVAAVCGAAVRVTWGPGERDLADSVAAAAGSGVQSAPETGSLLELAELLRRAAAFVSADTGPMHLAAACGTPCVALFGPKDPAIYRPYGEGHTVLHHRDRPGEPGILRITVEDVLSAVTATLRSRAA
jgi:ADP-heptose:LPS heptosyltransferase